MANTTTPDDEGGSSLQLSGVRAIALDTNAFGSRHLNLQRLRELVQRAAQHGGLEIWIPECVLWEWSEHAAAELQSAAASLRRVNSTGLHLATLDAVSAADVLSRLRSGCDAIGYPLRILPINDVAADALKDQIMLTGPAKAITTSAGSAVKTGAADSAAIRAILVQAENDSNGFVIVSADRDVAKAFVSWGLEPPIVFKSLHAAVRNVFAMVPSNAQVQAQCLALLVSTIDSQSLGRISGLDLPDFYGADAGEFANTEAFADEGRQVVGLSDVEVDRSAAFATATVHLLAAVQVSGMLQDATGDSLVQRHAEILGASVRITGTFGFEGGQPTSFGIDEGEGEGHRPRPDEYLSAEDALADVIECVGTLPGQSGFEWLEVYDDERARTLELPEGRLLLELEGDVYDAWELTASFRDTKVVVKCDFMNDGFADSEGFELPDHFALSSDADGFSRYNPVWAVNALVSGQPEYDYFSAQNPHQ